jgi:predicted DNA-binding protein
VEEYMKKDDIKQTIIRMPNKLYEKLSLLAALDDRSVNNYLVRILESHVNSEEIQKLLPDELKD